jgi:hypothetical protein
VRNRLDIEMKDIRQALQIMNEGAQAIDEKANPYKAQHLRKSESPQKAQEISLLK